MQSIQQLKPTGLLRYSYRAGWYLAGETTQQARFVKLLIVFITAYDEYAVKAFEHNAMDYPRKPINEERLLATWSEGSSTSVEQSNTNR